MIKPKILFAIADGGSGHRRVSEAIQDAIHYQHGDQFDTDIIDFPKGTGIPLFRTLPGLYQAASVKYTSAYDLSFRMTNNRYATDHISQVIFRLYHRRIVRFLDRVQPDLIVVANPLFIAHLLYLTRRKYRRYDYRLVTVVTDITPPHSGWYCNGVDGYIAPTEDIYDWLLGKGVPRGRITRTGYPIHRKFSAYSQTKAESRSSLGIDQDRFTILMTSGGEGGGNLMSWVLEFEAQLEGCQILAVTGRNHKAYETLKQCSTKPSTHIYGYVNNMETLMGASDVVISKAGPATVFEGLAMSRPMIVTSAVGQQEHGNIDFIRKNRLAFYCPTLQDAMAAIHRLADRESYEKVLVQLEMERSRFDNASADIAGSLVAELIKGLEAKHADGYRRYPVQPVEFDMGMDL